MSYKEFSNWCNDRACDGRWSLQEALVYIDMLRKIDAVCVKGLFKKRATRNAREIAWQKLISELKNQLE
jgi:hypothetical protein